MDGKRFIDCIISGEIGRKEGAEIIEKMNKEAEKMAERLSEKAGALSDLSAGLSDRADIWHHEREAFKEDIAKAIFSTESMSDKIDRAQIILSLIDQLELRDE